MSGYKFSLIGEPPEDPFIRSSLISLGMDCNVKVLPMVRKDRIIFIVYGSKEDFKRYYEAIRERYNVKESGFLDRIKEYMSMKLPGIVEMLGLNLE